MSGPAALVAALALLASAALSGCAGMPQGSDVVVTYQPDRYGVPVPVVDGIPYPMTAEERRAIGQAFVDAYCPADP